MMKRLLVATSIATLCLVSTASAAEKIEMWVRTGIGDSFKKVVEAYNASHENQVVTTEVPFGELVQKYATAIAGGQAPDALSMD
ncbi:MAG: sugar ABC transporter substrate-binding protein, partial [Rhizobium sp.]